MARAAATDDGKAAVPKKPSMISVVIEMAFLTCFAVGAGGLFGMMVLGGADKASATISMNGDRPSNSSATALSGASTPPVASRVGWCHVAG